MWGTEDLVAAWDALKVPVSLIRLLHSDNLKTKMLAIPRAPAPVKPAALKHAGHHNGQELEASSSYCQAPSSEVH
jgi:hypothetical protein